MASPAGKHDEVLEKARERFRAFLMTKGLRVTNQRMAILDACFRMERHFIAEQLLDVAREIDRSVSRATVYRSLPILTESGLVREIDVGRDHKFFMADRGEGANHVQIVCSDCDKIFELDAPFMEWYANSVSQKVGLKAESIRIQVVASCTDHSRCENCEKMEQQGGRETNESHEQN
ncbi:MAG: Fur family transcriptional regulator [Opitutales bacterium]|jgi:Fe2+ or Zn2+ uptake regulation protein